MSSKEVPVLTSAWLPDGTMLERLTGGRLASYRDGEVEVITEVEADNLRYSLAPLDQGVEQAFRIPEQVDDNFHLDALLTDLHQLLNERAGASDNETDLLLAGALATWVSDQLSCPVWLHISGPAAPRTLLPVVRALVRNPLVLNSVSIPELANLPAGLRPTLLITAASARTMRDVEAITSGCGAGILRGGSLRQIPTCSAITWGRGDAPAADLHIVHVPGSASSVLSQAALAAIERAFRPRLLAFRLHCGSLVGQTSNYEGASTAIVQLVALLGDAPEWQTRIVNALNYARENRASALCQTDAAYVTEALLALLHEGKHSAALADVAELTHAIMAGRGDLRVHTPKAVGQIVRQELGLTTRRKAAGYVVDVGEYADRIHRLASAFGSPSLLEARECSLCRTMTFGEDSQTEVFDASEDERHEVHHVHDAQDVHECDDHLEQDDDVHEVHQHHDAPGGDPVTFEALRTAGQSQGEEEGVGGDE